MIKAMILAAAALTMSATSADAQTMIECIFYHPAKLLH